MKLLNNKSEEFYIAHFHGRGLLTHPQTKGIPSFVLEIPIYNTESNKIQIITTATYDDIDRMILIKQLENNNIPYINKVPKDLNHRDWYNLKKIPIILESLKETDKEYSLFLDARDVIIMKDFDGMIDLFLTKNKKIMFGASINNFPYDTKADDFLDRNIMGTYKYLNSGTIFGKTTDLISYFEYLDSVKTTVINPVRDDQFLIRYTLEKFKDIVGYNYECDLFQTFGFTSLVIIDEEKEIYRAQ